MTINKSFEILEKLGVDMDSSSMMVFRAVLMAAGRLSKPTTYSEIADVLKNLTKNTYTKAYVYRQLNNLAQTGFVLVDEIKHPNNYTISNSSIIDALMKISKQATSQLLSRRQALSTQKNALDTTNPQDLAISMYNELVGKTSLNESTMIEGIENVRSTVIREFADEANAGDCVRVLASTSTLAEGLGPGGMTELRIMQGALKGVKIQGMLVPAQQGAMGTELIAGFLKTLAGAFVEAASTGNVSIRLAREPMQTYRMISLNKEKMLLYLTHTKESDTAALIHRKDNPGLIDDAVQTFDQLWEEGIDIINIIRQMINPAI